MQLKITEFNRDRYAGIAIISNTDSGLFAVQYETVEKADGAELRADRAWHYDQTNDYYKLIVPQARQRNVLRSITVARTSTNHYEIVYADKLGCIFETAKSITAVHETLTSLWKREFKL